MTINSLILGSERRRMGTTSDLYTKTGRNYYVDVDVIQFFFVGRSAGMVSFIWFDGFWTLRNLYIVIAEKGYSVALA